MTTNNKRGNNRGQSAAGAAVLLAIIAGLMIMFIVMIPPQERAELLGEDSDSSSTSSSNSSSGSLINLLTTSPGKLDYLATDEIEHQLPVIHVYTDVESKILTEKTIVYAKRGLFTSEPSIMKFSFDDVANAKNAYLSFKVTDMSGKLIIAVNGEKVFYSEIKAGEAKTIIVPTTLLSETNEVKFSVSSPRMAFWSTNEASLENVKFVTDVTNLDAQYSKNIFLISDDEKRNLERMTLRFQPDCQYGEAGRLEVSINSEQVYSGYPDCDLAMVPIEISPETIISGSNQIKFSVDKGTYLLSHVSLTSKLKDLDYPTYYFVLSEERYQDIADEEYLLRLKLSFVDVNERKKGEVFVNGHVASFDTEENTYLVEISEDAVKGTNSVKIKPQKTLEIRELKVDMVK